MKRGFYKEIENIKIFREGEKLILTKKDLSNPKTWEILFKNLTVGEMNCFFKSAQRVYSINTKVVKRVK